MSPVVRRGQDATFLSRDRSIACRFTCSGWTIRDRLEGGSGRRIGRYRGGAARIDKAVGMKGLRGRLGQHDRIRDDGKPFVDAGRRDHAVRAGPGGAGTGQRAAARSLPRGAAAGIRLDAAAAAPGLTSTTKSESMTLPSIPTSTSASRSPTRVDSPRAARTAAAGRLSSVCPRPRSALFVPIGLRSRARRISRFWLTENPVGLIRERLTSASLLPQSHPTLRHNQGIARILRVVLHRRG